MSKEEGVDAGRCGSPVGRPGEEVMKGLRNEFLAMIRRRAEIHMATLEHE